MKLRLLPSFLRQPAKKLAFNFVDWVPYVHRQPFLNLISFQGHKAPTIILCLSLFRELQSLEHFLQGYNLIVLRSGKGGKFSKNSVLTASYIPNSLFVSPSFSKLEQIDSLLSHRARTALLLRHPLHVGRSLNVDGFVLASLEATTLSTLQGGDDRLAFQANFPTAPSIENFFPNSSVNVIRHLVVGSVFAKPAAANSLVGQSEKPYDDHLTDVDMINFVTEAHSKSTVAYMRNPMLITVSKLDFRGVTQRFYFDDLLLNRSEIQTLYGCDSTVELLGHMFGISSVRLDKNNQSNSQKSNDELYFAATRLIHTSNRPHFANGSGRYDATFITIKTSFPDNSRFLSAVEALILARESGNNLDGLHDSVIDHLISVRHDKTNSIASIQLFCEQLATELIDAADTGNFIRMIAADLPLQWFPLKKQLSLFRQLVESFRVTLNSAHYDQMIDNGMSDAQRLLFANVLANCDRDEGVGALLSGVDWGSIEPIDAMISITKSCLKTRPASDRKSKHYDQLLSCITRSGDLWQKIWTLDPQTVTAALEKNDRLKEDAVETTVLSIKLANKSTGPPPKKKLRTLANLAKNQNLSLAIFDQVINIIVARSRFLSALSLLRVRFNDDPKSVRDYTIRRTVALLLMRKRTAMAKRLLRWGNAVGIGACSISLNAQLIHERAIESDIKTVRAKLRSVAPNEVIRIADAMQAVGRDKDAFNLLEKSVRNGKLNDNTALLPMARLLRTLGRFSDAIAFCETLEPQRIDVELARELSLCLTAAGQLREAIELLEIVLDRHSFNVPLLLHTADLLSKVGKFRRAAELYQRVIGKNPVHPIALRAWGKCVVKNGEAEKHIERLENACANAGSESYLLCHLSIVFIAQGRLGDAADAAFRAIRKQPANLQIAKLASDILTQTDDKMRLKALTDRQLKAQVSTSQNRLHNAQSHLAENNRALARVAAIDAVQLAPSDPHAHFMKGRIEFEIGDLEQAAVDFASALSCNPAYYWAAGQLARVQLQQNNTELAQQTIKTAIQISRLNFQSTNSQLLTIEAEIADATGNFEKARDSFEAANIIQHKNGNASNMRVAWSAGLAAAALGDLEGQAKNVQLVSDAIHHTLPSNICCWQGESLEGKHAVLAMRGGPGDEMRTVHSVLSFLTAQNCKLTIIADARLHAVYKHNFPDIDLIANPKAGRRLVENDKPIARAKCNSLAPLTYEAWSRFGLYLPRKLMEQCDYLLISDDLWQHAYFNEAHKQPASQYQQPITMRASKIKTIKSYLRETGPSFKVAISWRGGYFSANRPQTAFMNVDELGPLFALDNVDFIDVHPNRFENEYLLIRKKFPKARLFRPEKFDLMNDFETLGLLFQNVDASIVPGITQRDVAAAFGGNNILSFGLKAGALESWRVDAETKKDRVQSSIMHFTLNDYGNRKTVVQALADKIAALRDEMLASV